jgi:hypothetical protein
MDIQYRLTPSSGNLIDNASDNLVYIPPNHKGPNRVLTAPDMHFFTLSTCCLIVVRTY